MWSESFSRHPKARPNIRERKRGLGFERENIKSEGFDP